MMAREAPTPPEPPEPPSSTTSFTISSSDLFGGKTCGGFINTSTKKWSTSTTYYGVIMDIRGFEGGTVSFVRASSATLVRYAFLSASTYQNNTIPSFSSGTTQETNDTDVSFTVTIPADGHYLYVYTYSSKTNVAPTTTISVDVGSKYVNLESSLFDTNTTIGTNGTVYTGNDAPYAVCSSYLAVSEYAYCQEANVIVNGLPSGVDNYTIAIAEYTANQKFIRRDAYTVPPFTVSLNPACGYVRFIVVCQQNGQDMSGDVIRFSGNMLQVETINSE